MEKSYLIKNARILDPGGRHHRQFADILIQNETIKHIAEDIPQKNAHLIQHHNLHISPGWLDIGTQICDPGLEHREDLDSVTAAAAAGGFTGIASFPNTQPCVHDHSQVKYLLKQTRGEIVDFLPIGAVTKDCAGKDITEMYDMKAAGAVAFSDGNQPIADNGMMLRTLQYVLPFGGVVINHPHDKATAHGGQMHEGLVSTSLGMKGIPALSEELMVVRDIHLAQYTGSRVHIHNVSTAGAVQLIREAQAKGVQVTGSVAALNLAFEDNILGGFDTRFKVLPPLREKADRKALKTGLQDGTITCITSNHTPWHQEAKDLEFPYAEFGVPGLESAFGLAWRELNGYLPLEQMIIMLCCYPRELLGQAIPHIEEGKIANISFFDPDAEYVFTKEMLRSKSPYNPLIGESLKGRVYGVFNNGHWSN